MKAHIKDLRISPLKLNAVAQMVRGKSVDEALSMLRFTNKKAASLLYKALASAAANAQNQGESKENLQVSSLLVTKGRVLKRFRPVSRGRAHPILKHASHVRIELGKR